MNWSGWIEPMLCRVFRRSHDDGPKGQREPRPREPEPQARSVAAEREQQTIEKSGG